MSKMTRDEINTKLASLDETNTKIAAITKDAPEGELVKEVYNSLWQQTVLIKAIMEQLHT